MGAQPLLWKQAATSALHRGWSLRNILLYPLIKYRYKFKNNESYLLDYLLVGSNPVISLILLKKLAQFSFLHQTNIKVGVLNVVDSDYWAYHQFKKEDFWKELLSELNIKNSKADNFFSTVVSNVCWDYIEPVFINNENLSLQYIKKDNHVKGFVAHLINKETSKEDFSKEIPTVIKLENELKESLWKSVTKAVFDLVPSVKKMNWSHPPQKSLENEENSHILLTKNIYLSSLPSGWLNIESENKTQYTFFNHDFSKFSFASAAKIANSFELLEKQVIEDIKEVEKFKIEKS